MLNLSVNSNAVDIFFLIYCCFVGSLCGKDGSRGRTFTVMSITSLDFHEISAFLRPELWPLPFF